MKIALIRRGHSPTGGAEAYLRRFASGAAAAGHECTLFTGTEWPAAGWEGEIRRFRHAGSPLEFALELSRSADARACDVIFSLERVLACDCYRAGDGVHAAWIERRAAYESGWRSWWRGKNVKHHELLRLEETLFRGEGAREVIANSNLVREEIVRHFGYPAERIHVLHNGVPPPPPVEEGDRLRQEVRRELGLGEADYVLLFAGSGWERKGLRWAIRAMDGAAVAGATLLVAGSGAPRQMPRSSRVRYLGAVPGIARLLAAADAFILPTIYDPFSNACLEALAAGLPVVTTRANGFSEIVENGVEGDVVERADDVAALTAAIEAWAPMDRRAAIREPLRQKGATFSIDENVRRTLTILNSLPGKASGER